MPFEKWEWVIWVHLDLRVSLIVRIMTADLNLPTTR